MSSPEKSGPGKSGADGVRRDRTDVVVVGARISGSAVAIALARAGLSVTMVDRAQFPSDTLSTHLIQVTGARCLQKLGVLDDLMSTKAPFLGTMRIDYDGIDLSSVVRTHRTWPSGGISVNRNLLDKFLVDVAEAEGVDVRLRTSLVGLRTDRSGRVNGVELKSGGKTRILDTALVIGADGRNSKVADLVGARTYNVTANERFVYWADFEGVEEAGPPAVHTARDGEDITVAFQSDNGKFTVMVSPGMEHFGEFKRNLPESYDAAVAACLPLKPYLAGAKRAARPTGTAYTPGYFRESAGAGWVLIGDAGHFKDPLVGLGITDALRQAEKLGRLVSMVDFADRPEVDRALRVFWRWRDHDHAPMYWLTCDLAKAGRMEPLQRAMLECVAEDGRIRQKLIDEVMSHRASPYSVLTPSLLLRAAKRLRTRGGFASRDVARMVAQRVAAEVRHQLLNRKPRFEPLPKPAGGASGARSAGDVWAGDITAGRSRATATAAPQTTEERS